MDVTLQHLQMDPFRREFPELLLQPLHHDGFHLNNPSLHHEITELTPTQVPKLSTNMAATRRTNCKMVKVKLSPCLTN
jgi:hypothetical protein